MSILDLEHDGNEYVPAMFPLGQDPDHCPRCRDVRETRLRQAACPHDEGDLVVVDVTRLGDAIRRQVAHCGACGKPGRNA